MVSTRSSSHDSKPQSPNQEMSETKMKGYGGVFDVSDRSRKANEVKLQGDDGNAEKTDVEMVAEAEEGKAVVSGEVQNGENLPEKMDIETVEGDKDIVEPESTVDNCGEGESVHPGGKTSGDERPEDVKNGDAKLVKSSENGCEESVDLSSGGAEPATPHAGLSDVKAEDKKGLENEVNGKELTTPMINGRSSSKYNFLSGGSFAGDGNDSGTEEEQLDFVKEIEEFFKSRNLEYKPPKFYGDTVNCLKLYKIVMGLGGYDTVTTSKLWKQVGAYFKPPRTCTSLSYAFRGFYEKALLDYEKHEAQVGKFSTPIASRPNPISVNTKASRPKPMTIDTKASQSKPKNVDTKAMDVDNQVSGTGRRRRESAARAMQGWHSQRLLANGEVSEPIIKDKNATSLQKQEKQHKTSGSQKRKKPPGLDPVTKVPRDNASTLRLDVDVSDLGTPADWVKVNVQKAKDCFEVYALIPGLLREEVRVQSDPAGRLVISGEPEQADNPWGVTPFKKAVILPSRIDPHGTSAVVTLHGQLFIRVPFGQSEE